MKGDELHTLLLEEKDIVELINNITLTKFYKKLIKSLENGFKDLAEKKIKVIPRPTFHFMKGTVESMPASNEDYFATKIVNTHLENIKTYNIPTIMGLGILVDGKTGFPLLITESTILTAIRTAAVSAIATKYLAKDESKVFGIIGTGAQSLFQLHAISLVRDFEKIYAFDIDVNTTKDFKNNAREMGFEVRIIKPEKLCELSDIIVTITAKKKGSPPVVYDDWIKNGTHINAVGGDSPGKIEVDKKLLLRSKLIVDYLDQAIVEGETQQVGKNHVHAELKDIVTGLKVGRDNDGEITIFDSVGFAMEDLMTFQLVYELARKTGIFKNVKVIALPKYPKNLYGSYFTKINMG